MATRTFTVPDLLDDKGRAIARARVKARRIDTHVWLAEEQFTDEYGQCTFTTLPTDVTCVFIAQWGDESRWFFSHIVSVEEGGTGGSDPETALDNLEVGEAAILWAVVL